MSEWNEYNLNEVYDFASGLSKGAEEFGFGNGFLGFTDIFKNFFVSADFILLERLFFIIISAQICHDFVKCFGI